MLHLGTVNPDAHRRLGQHATVHTRNSVLRPLIRATQQGTATSRKIEAKCRAKVFKNPDRFVIKQAGSFQATLAATDFANGSLFLAAELDILHKHAPTALRVQEVFRDDYQRGGPYDPDNYQPDQISGGIGDPIYGC